MLKIKNEEIKRKLSIYSYIIGIIIMLSVLLALLLTGCTTWMSNATTGYEITGATLTSVYDTSKTLCDSGTIKQEDCEKIKSIYNKTRMAYITAGNALIIAINTDDAIVRQKNLDAYTKAINDVAALLPELIKVSNELGVKL